MSFRAHFKTLPIAFHELVIIFFFHEKVAMLWFVILVLEPQDAVRYSVVSVAYDC